MQHPPRAKIRWTICRHCQSIHEAACIRAVADQKNIPFPRLADMPLLDDPAIASTNDQSHDDNLYIYSKLVTKHLANCEQNVSPHPSPPVSGSLSYLNISYLNISHLASSPKRRRHFAQVPPWLAALGSSAALAGGTSFKCRLGWRHFARVTPGLAAFRSSAALVGGTSFKCRPCWRHFDQAPP